MATTFEACPSCARHIKVDEAACPFCGCPTPEGFSAVVRGKPGGAAALSRAAILFMGATATVACGSSSSGGEAGVLYGPAPVHDSGTAGVVQDGGSPVDSAVPEGSVSDAPTEDAPVVLYGPAPIGPTDGSAG